MTEFFRKYKFILVGIAFAIILTIVFVPDLYVNYYLAPYYYRYVKEPNKIQDIKDSRESIVKIIAGALGILGAAYGFHLNTKRTKAIENQTDSIFKQTSATIEQVETSKQQVETSKQQLQELIKKNADDKIIDTNNLVLQQFSKASELLKDENIAARLSGIHLFEQIMNTNEDYHITVIEILTAFVREKRGRYDDKNFVDKYEVDDVMFDVEGDIIEWDLENFEKK